MAYLGTALPVIDQAALPAGSPGISRRDLALAVPVVLKNADNASVTSWYWKIIAKPPGSAAALTTAVGSSTSFVPDIVGSYLIELKVNQGHALNQTKRILAAVEHAGTGYRFPVQEEAAEANWISPYSGVQNTRGWADDFDGILRDVAAKILALNASVVTINNEAASIPGSRRLVLGANLSGVDAGPGSTYTLNTAVTPGTKLLADVVGQAENIIGTRATNPPTRSAAAYGQTNLGSQVIPARGTTANYASICGGVDNLASGVASHVGGGSVNTASGASAVVAGGASNTAMGAASAVCGGTSNTAGDANSFVGAGSSCQASAPRSVCCGGDTNNASGDNAFAGAGNNNNPDGAGSAVVAGNTNQTSGAYNFIGAGQNNSSGSNYSGIVAGDGNTTSADNAFVGAGDSNTASGARSSVVGGNQNSALGADSFIGGGSGNTAQGLYASVAGGRDNFATGDDSHAIGRSIVISHNGAVIIGDGSATAKSSSANNEVTLFGSGNIRMMTNGGKLQRRLSSSSNCYGENIQGVQTTTNAVAQTVTIATIPSGASLTVTVKAFNGKRSTNADLKSLDYKGVFTNNGGVVALTGAHVNNTVNTAGAAAWNAAVSISGTNIQINFTGAAATTIRWSWDIELNYGGQT